jgi:hypothetical protein
MASKAGATASGAAFEGPKLLSTDHSEVCAAADASHQHPFCKLPCCGLIQSLLARSALRGCMQGLNRNQGPSLRGLRDLHGTPPHMHGHHGRALQQATNFLEPAKPTFTIFSALHDAILGEV